MWKSTFDPSSSTGGRRRADSQPPIDTDPARHVLVAGLAHFAERTSALLLAEGIETEAELAALRTLGVPQAQGYLFGRSDRAG